MKGEIKMARYKIYDNKSDVITPAGEKLTAEQLSLIHI